MTSSSAAASSSPIQIEVWSDVVCPWCYIGKRRLEAALARFEGQAQVTWRSFELDPGAPERIPGPLTELLAKKYGMSLAQARQAQERVTQVAAEDGLTFALDDAQSGNTFGAHRLLQRANELGLGDALKERLMQAYFSQGMPISDPDTLGSLAEQIGMSPQDVELALTQERYATLVREDERAAQRLGVRGVPFFVIQGRWGVSGAQPAQSLLDALRAAWQQLPFEQRLKAAQPGPTCDDDGCELPGA